jgi:hypothetical protein
MSRDVKVLHSVKWAFLGLERDLQQRIVRCVKGLAKGSRGARRIAGTNHVFRVRVQRVGLLYHELDGQITLLAIVEGRSTRQIEAAVRALRAQRGSSGSGRGTHGGGSRSLNDARPA